MAYAASSQSPSRIALFEEHPLVAEGLEALLHAHGVTVVGRAKNLDALLGLVDEHRPDVAVVGIVPCAVPHAVMSSQRAALADLATVAAQVPTLALVWAPPPGLVGRCAAAGARGCVLLARASGVSLADAIVRIHAGDAVFPAEEARRPTGVSPREFEVLLLVGEGADNAAIARALQITERTVKAHVTSLYRKVGAENRIQLALLARDSQQLRDG